MRTRIFSNTLLPLAWAPFAWVACVDTPVSPPPPFELAWDKTLPAMSTLNLAPQMRGLRVVRGIVHLHSVFSHDACDGKPHPGGKPNAPCLQNLRQALCATRQDFALLTDHATLMTSADFADLFLPDAAAGDVPERVMGSPGIDVVGNSMACDPMTAPGHRVHLAVGGENDLMPVALRQHLGGSQAMRQQAMTADTPDAVRAFHAAGGVVLQAHGESRTLEQLRVLAAAGLDGMEVYNLHANLDPKIRGPYLGLDPLGAITGLAPWLGAGSPAEGGPEPDLALLGFLGPNQPQLDRFDALLGQGHVLSPVLGSDIHENTLREPLSDGERGDGYRRLMRWFTNHLLVPQAPLSTETLAQALAGHRGYGVFELFGSPAGFDFYATTRTPTGTQVHELGSVLSQTTEPILHVFPPRPFPDAYHSQSPDLRVIIRFIAENAVQAVDVLNVVTSADEVRLPLSYTLKSADRGPGVYRVEVHIVPRHLLHLLGEKKLSYVREYPFLYSAPIVVRR